MGGDTHETTTSTQSTAPSNPKVTETVNQLLGGVQSEYAKGPQPFNESLYAGVGPTTQAAWALGKSTANNPAYSAGINSGINYNSSLAGSGGLAGGMGADIAGTRGVAGQFGALAGSARAPSLTENTLLDVAQGKYLNETDPNFQAMIDRAANGTAADINAAIGSNGRYASNVHANALGEQLGALRTNAAWQERNMQLGRQTDALAAIEGQRQQGFNNQASALSAQLAGLGQSFGMDQQGVNNAFAAQTMLPGLFSAAQLPAAAYGAIGAAEDADKQAALMGRYDLQQRQANARSDQLAKLSSILSGNAAASGSTTTATNTTPTTPWWQTGLGLGLGAAGLFL